MSKIEDNEDEEEYVPPKEEAQVEEKLIEDEEEYVPAQSEPE